MGAVAPAGVRDLASGNPDPELLPDLTPILRRLEAPRQLYGGDPVDPGCSSWRGRSSAGTGSTPRTSRWSAAPSTGSSAPWRRGCAPAT